MTGRQIRIDDDPIKPVGQTRHLAMGETKTPVFSVIGGPIRYPVRLIGQGVEMRAQLGERHDRIDWRAVLDDVEIAVRKVHNMPAVGARDVGVTDVPLARHGPVQDRRPRGNLIDRKRDIALDDAERLP